MPNKKHVFSFVVLIVVLQLSFIELVLSQDDQFGLCGIYSVYAGSHVVGQPIPAEQLHEMRYVSKDFGSSLRELSSAVDENGLSSRVIGGISLSTLSSSSEPIVLHFRNRMMPKEFTHWVLFIGMTKSGRYRILEPSFGVEEMSSTELSSRFDGTGLMMAKDQKAIDLAVRKMTIQQIFDGVGWSITLIMATSFFGFALREKGFLSKIATYLLCVGVTSFLFNRYIEGGLLIDKHFADRVVASRQSHELDTIERADLVQMLEKNQKFQLVDARFPSSYSHGTIANAINYPLSISVEKEKDILAPINRETKVVVFCQSQQCGYAGTIANRIKQFGYQDVVVFEDGILGWFERRGEE